MPLLSALLTVAGLILLAALLIWPVQSAMVRRQIFRREPLLALLVWQAVALAAVISLLAVGPVTLFLVRDHVALGEPRHLVIVGVALAVTGFMIVRLLIAGHQVGATLRRTRREHIDLLELVGREFDKLDLPESPQHLRVIDHPAPTAYCIPGLTHRVVISTGMLDQLAQPEVRAVLAHERAHVRARHDLLVEFFTVLHTAMPERLRQHAVLEEVRLLAEVLADRAGARSIGRVPMGRALVALAGSRHPVATFAASTSSASSAQVRLSLLSGTEKRSWVMVATMIGYGLLSLILPAAVVLWIMAVT